MAATYADDSHVQARFGRALTDAEVARVNAWLSDVETTIKVRLPDLDARVAAQTLSWDVVNMVVANAVVRRLQNPEGLRTTTMSVDDGAVTKTRSDSPLTSATAWLTEDEWDLLDPPVASEAASLRYSYTPGWCGDALTPWGRP